MSVTSIDTTNRAIELHVAVPAGEGPWPGVVVVHDIEVYPSAGHGFLNDHHGETPLWALVAGWYAHTGYDETAASDARERIIAFFDRHLAG